MGFQEYWLLYLCLDETHHIEHDGQRLHASAQRKHNKHHVMSWKHSAKSPVTNWIFCTLDYGVTQGNPIPACIADSSYIRHTNSPYPPYPKQAPSSLNPVSTDLSTSPDMQTPETSAIIEQTKLSPLFRAPCFQTERMLQVPHFHVLVHSLCCP